MATEDFRAVVNDVLNRSSVRKGTYNKKYVSLETELVEVSIPYIGGFNLNLDDKSISLKASQRLNLQIENTEYRITIK